MKLHFLGTTGYHPNNQRQTACLMLPELGVIFDAGTGIFRARDLIQTEHLDIFLSHVHLDHCVGLTFLYDVLWEKNVSRVTVHVNESKIAAIRDGLFHRDLFPVKPNFDIVPLQTTTELAGGVQVRSFPLKHPGGAHGFHLTTPQAEEKSIAYVTDTVADPKASYLKFIENVDTLVHECYFPDGCEDRAELTGHSCLTPVAEVAAACKAGKLFLVHVNPLDPRPNPLDLKSIESIFPNTAVAHDGQAIEI